MIQKTYPRDKGDYAKKPLYSDEIKRITMEVCFYFGVTLKAIKSETRLREIVLARHVAMYLCQEKKLGSQKNIGAFFGGRDHSTINHAVGAINDLLETDSNFVRTMEQVRFRVFKPGTFLRFSFEMEKNLDVLQELKNQI
jgi:chromosomal replication initiation ATPase DnaA